MDQHMLTQIKGKSLKLTQSWEQKLPLPWKVISGYVEIKSSLFQKWLQALKSNSYWNLNFM